MLTRKTTLFAGFFAIMIKRLRKDYSLLCAKLFFSILRMACKENQLIGKRNSGISATKIKTGKKVDNAVTSTIPITIANVSTKLEMTIKKDCLK